MPTATRDSSFPAKPELLAPAGSIETFHAAIEAGADAVYLGLDKFNARLRARNFTARTLARLVPFAHGRAVRVHVTLNTLVQQQELGDLADTLHALEQIGPDAVIVQDTGVAAIAAKWFPKLAVHGSTQMAIHNRAGVEFAAGMGLRRVILARELSLNEIGAICRQSPVEIEVFAHGALCYSLSGLCLASSYLGGQSGNRGACTQVCRRRYRYGDRAGYPFSCRDLWGIDRLADYARMGVSSLKIEGRMRRAEYVYTVVRAYRMALDNPESLAEAREMLRRDFGREKTTFFLGGSYPLDAIDADAPPGTGILLGAATVPDRDRVAIDTTEEVEAGDRVRLQSADGSEGRGAQVLEVTRTRRGRLLIAVPDGTAPKDGEMVYVTARASMSLPRSTQAGRTDAAPVPFSPHTPLRGRILDWAGGGRHAGERREPDLPAGLYLRVDSLSWFPMVSPVPCAGVIVGCEIGESAELADRLRSGESRAANVIVALPPFIPESKTALWRDAIAVLAGAGVRSWLCGQAGQIGFVRDIGRAYADHWVWCLNRAALRALDDSGFEGYVCSPEDDYLNLRATATPRAFCTVWGTVPVFVSRLSPPVGSNDHLVDLRGQTFVVHHRHGLHYTVADKPLCLTHRRRVLAEAGLQRFIVDLSFRAPNRDTLRTVLDHYEKMTRMPGTTLFNHKAGLKGSRGAAGVPVRKPAGRKIDE